MTTVLEILGQLRAGGANLSLDGDALKISAPKGVITPEYREILTARKAEIVSFLRASLEAARAGGLAITKAPRTAAMPLSYAQQRLWFLHQLDGGGAYNIPAGLHMRGGLDPQILEKALASIIERHESLRTRFINKDGTPYSVIDTAANWHLEYIDLKHLPLNQRDAASLTRTIEFSQQPFDLAQDRLVRAALVSITSETHLLIVSMHHIISDGWSMGVLVRELTESYSALKRGVLPAFAPLTIQYADFAHWQREWLGSGELDRQLPYWQKHLAGLPPLVEFPADFRRTQAETFQGQRSRIILSKSLVASLEQLSRTHNVTLFMLLLAAFKTLLFRYTGQEDVVVGTPSANRNRSELHPLIGFFVNNLVLRTSLEGNPTFLELLARVREVTLRAYDHQDVPFDTLVQVLRTERSTDHSPLFQTMFSFQNFPLDDFEVPGLVVTPLELDAGASKFDLTVEIYPHHGELRTYFEYKTDLYHPDTITALQKHFVALLESIVADPTQPVGFLTLLSSDEMKNLSVTRNSTAAPYPSGICVHQRFEELAARYPERIAVTTATSQLTYGQLNQRANQIAHQLISSGTAPGSIVAIYIDRSVDMLASLLGILKTGAAYVPLDPIYPQKRIAGILEEACPTVVLTTTSLGASLSDLSAQVICIDALRDLDIGRCSLNPDIAVGHTDMAYVIFTSGSTGKPKGVQISHGALMNFLESMSHSPGISSDDVLLAVTTISFDIAGLELYLPLYVGARVYISIQPNDVTVLVKELSAVRPTIMQATPATWQMLVDSEWGGDPELKMLCGGEALSIELANSLLSKGASLWNMYGPTETTIWSAVSRVEAPGDSGIPIGPPIANTSFYILDSQRQLVPVGVAGELYIGGSGVAHGYLNRPDLTSERFIPDTFQQSREARLYRTGDLVRYRRTGEIEFLGRIDHQVKLRGFRIELGEIEISLRSVPGINDAVVTMRDDNGDKYLVSYILADQVNRPPESLIRDQLRQTLPEYMLPRSLVFLDKFPRTPNGKLDRAALPAPGRPTSRGIYVAPATPAESAIADVFKELLQIDLLSMKDNFFELGAHSLLIAKAHDKLKHTLDPNLQLIDFFQYPTIEALANSVSSHHVTIAQNNH